MRARSIFVLLLICGFAAIRLLPASEISVNSGDADLRLPEETAAGVAEFHAGHLDAAREHLLAAVSADKNDHAACGFLGQIARGHCGTQKALEFFCKALQGARRSPWAECYLICIENVLSSCSDPQVFVKVAQHLLRDDKCAPFVRDWVRQHYGQWLLKTGDFAAAAEVFKPLGYLDRWALAGPMDNRDGAGFDAAGEPETLIDFGKSTAGRNRRVGLFQTAVKPIDGKIVLKELFEPRKHVLAYGAAFVKAGAAGWSVLRAGCAGALDVWVNGRKAGAVGAYNDFGSEKLAVPVYLYAGWNQILVKSGVVEDGEWAFSVRLCRPEGGPYPGLMCDSSAEALAAYTAESKNRAAAPEISGRFSLGLLRQLEQSLAKTPDDVRMLSAYALLLDHCKIGGCEDRLAPKQLQKAIALAPRSPLLRLQLAACSGDKNEARLAAEAAAQACPELPLPLEYLAFLAAESGLKTIAESYAWRAEKLAGPETAVTAVLVLADILSEQRPSGDDVSRRADALRLLQSLVEKHPYCAMAWQQLCSLESSGTVRRAALRKALAYCGGDVSLRRQWAQELTAMCKEDEAAAILSAEAAAQPFRVSLALELAAQHRRAGHDAREKDVLAQARQLAPENVDVLYALGQVLQRSGNGGEAQALFREVLRLKPNSPQVKDYLSQLADGGATDRQFFAACDIALKDLPSPQALAYPHDNSVNLLSQQVVRLNPNGSCSRMVHLVVKLLRASGVREMNQQTIYYEPQRQTVDILKAAVITPEGRELSRAEIHDRSTSAAMGVQTLIYDEHHLKQIYFKDLEPGSIIDLQYIIRDSGDNIYGDFFADTAFLSDDQTTLKSQYVLDYPKNLGIQSRVFNHSLQPERLNSPDPRREVLKWELNDAPGISRENGMPPLQDQLVQLQISTMSNWQDVGKWYWNLAKDQLAVSGEMRKDIQAITRNCKTQTEKLRAIHDWVIRKIRYLGIELGRNGYRPHKASETYKALYGDCKDTATLLAAMLPAAGIDCDLVLIRTMNAGALKPDALAMPNVFNHCIAHVPSADGKEYWIDGTTDFFQLGEVPWSDQGARVLVVDQNGGGKFVQIPVSTGQENLIEQSFDAKVERDGSATLTLRDSRHGQFAPSYRELADTPGHYERFVQDYAARCFNGAKVAAHPDGSLKIKRSGAEEQGAVWMETVFQAPSLAADSGDRKALPATFDPLQMSARFASETTRKFDLEIWYPWARKTHIVFRLDPAQKVSALPEEAEINEPFGRFVRKVTPQNQSVEVTEYFELSRSRISVAEYEKFRAFCNRVDSLLDQKILLQGK